MAQAGKAKRPQRSCVACGRKADKAGLFRLFCDFEGRVALDVSGKEPGRGAYVCDAACLERAYRTKRIERALRSPVPREDYEPILLSLSQAARVN
ncbi:MAG: YlxR family protein [Eggerthellaceae bacterium]|nr:YlxR family protein [Eggerthellaceae bacterium]